MAISTQENLLTLSQAAAMVPRMHHKKCATSTIWRWCSKGLKGVRLDHKTFGGRIVTSREALDRFLEELSEARIQSNEKPLVLKVPQKRQRTSSREKSIRQANEILKKAGIC